MSKFFNNKKKSNLKISNPINFNDASSPGRIVEAVPLTKPNNSDGSPRKRVKPYFEDPAIKSLPTTPNESAIILIAKHNFQAHNSKELTVSAGEPLKLLSRQGNGWILVKPIGRLGGPGLVPSAYCSMVNTGSSSFDEEWLNGSDINLPTNYSEMQLRQLGFEKQRSGSGISEASSNSSGGDSSASSSMDRTSPTSLSSLEDFAQTSKQFTNSISVKTVSSHKGRYWYRTDVILPNGKTRCLCRYYQDFYSLHASLCDQFHSNDYKNYLPKLPGPIPRPDPEVLLQRCHDLNTYTQRLLHFFASDMTEKEKAFEIFKNWLNIREGDVEIDERQYSALRTEDINKLIDPVSPTANSFKDQAKRQQQQQLRDFAKPPLAMDVVNIQLLDSTEPSPLSSPLTTSPDKFKHNNKEDEEPPTTPKKQQLKVETNLEYSPTSPLFHNNKPKLDFITERRTHSPVLPSQPSFGSSTSAEDYIRVKVIYNDGNDIIAMKMLKDSNLTILKLSISSKIQIFDYVLTYKDVKSGFFKPLRTNKDLEDAVNKNKIIVKVNEANVL